MPESTKICLNVNKYSSIGVINNVTLWIWLNMREILGAQISQSSIYAWICLNKVQNIHKLLLSNTWIMCLKLTKYVYSSEYALISRGFCGYSLMYMNSLTVPGFWICLILPRYTPNVGKYASVCLTLWIWLNMPET